MRLTGTQHWSRSKVDNRYSQYGDCYGYSYSEALLAKSQDLIAKNEFSIAVVVAHMACEIGAERAISQAFMDKGIEFLKEPVFDLLTGYNLANERIRNLYNAVTGNELQKQPFWQAFKDRPPVGTSLCIKALA